MKTLAAGGIAFVGYAIYFDRKRRLDPNYKQKIRQNRKAKQARASNAASSGVEFPDPRDVQANEQFFFQQISLGEERMQSGSITEGIIHLSNAVVSCQQPAELLTIFRQTIPPEHFEMLVQSIPSAKMRQQASLRKLPAFEGIKIEDEEEEGSAAKKVFVLDDDLE